MCELLAVCSSTPVTVGVSLERLARRGGIDGPHRDGWGVAFYQGRDVYLLREPQAAAHSELVRYIEKHSYPSRLVISHIRHATQGDCTLANTQPFQRELQGRQHVFAHNGEAPAIEQDERFRAERFLPVGETDSEHAFCNLMQRMACIWSRRSAVPTLRERLDVVEGFAIELRELGPSNFIYCDGDALFAHAHYRRQSDGSEGPPGLHYLLRRVHESADDLGPAGLSLDPEPRQLLLLASVPLSDDSWQALPEGCLLVARDGLLQSMEPV